MEQRLFVVSVLIALSVVLGPPCQEAHAGFGPSLGATTSPPPGVASPRVQDHDIKTSSKKLQQWIGSTLHEQRLEDFNAQLDDIVESLKNRDDTSTTTSTSTSSSKSLSEEEKADNLSSKASHFLLEDSEELEKGTNFTGSNPSPGATVGNTRGPTLLVPLFGGVCRQCCLNVGNASSGYHQNASSGSKRFYYCNVGGLYWLRRHKRKGAQRRYGI